MIPFIAPFNLFADTTIVEGVTLSIRYFSTIIIDEIQVVDSHTTYYNINDVPQSSNTVPSSYRVLYHVDIDYFTSDPAMYQSCTVNIPLINGGTSTAQIQASGTYGHRSLGPANIVTSDLSTINVTTVSGYISFTDAFGFQEVVSLNSEQFHDLMQSILTIDQSTYLTDQDLLTFYNWVKNTMLPTLVGEDDQTQQAIANFSALMHSDIQHFENNIDDLIDTISWKDADVTFYGVSTTFDGPYSTDSITSNSTDLYFKFKSNVSLPPGLLYKINSGIFANNYIIGNNGIYISEIYVNGTNVTDNPSKYVGEYYINRTSAYPTLYMQMYAYGNNDDRVVIIHFKRYLSSGTFLRFNSSRVSFSCISELDIEYWKLLDSITLQNWFDLFQTDYTGGSPQLNSQSSSVSSVTNTVHNAEQQQFTDFNAAFQQMDFSVFTLTGDILNTSNWLANQIQILYNNTGDFKILMVMPLILGIVMFLIGRGSNIFRPRQEYEKPQYDLARREWHQNSDGTYSGTSYYTRRE